MVNPRVLIALFLATLFPQTSFAQSILVVLGNLPADFAAQVHRHVDHYGDYGDFAVCEGDPKAVEALAALGFEAKVVGVWQDDWAIYAAPKRYMPKVDTTLLFERGSLALFATSSERIKAFDHLKKYHVERRAFVPGAGFQRPGGVAKAVTVSPVITNYVNQVSQANLQSVVTHLSTAYFTRRGDSAMILQAKDWLVQQLQAIPGLTITTPPLPSGYAPNIVIEIPGITHPERVVIGGAHYDSINNGGSSLQAPGADDDGTGTSAIVETARVLAQGQFENTIRLVLFSSEELGLIGSGVDANTLAQSSAQLLAMLNMDMIAHLEAGDTKSLDFVTNDSDPALIQFCRDVATAYVPSLPTKAGSLSAGTSDHKSYSSIGVPAVFFFEDIDNYSPVIHTANDVIGASVNDFSLMHDIAKVYVATIASIASPLDMEITHTPIADTVDSGGPYRVIADVTSLTSSQVANVDLNYRVDGGTWLTKPMLAGATPDSWLQSIPGLSHGVIDYFILATDSTGAMQWSPDGNFAGENTHSFVVGNVAVSFFDDFEGGDNGWTSALVLKQDDWQKGTPQGAGGYDPVGAASGLNARGNDLGLSGFNGIYQSDVDNYLQSPSIDCSALTNTRLRFRRWLSVEDGAFDQATVLVNGQQVWQNPATPGGGSNHVIDNQWTFQDLDISAIADGNPAVTVRFQLQTDGGLEFGGWTIDDVAILSVADGNVPPLTASEAYTSGSAGGSVVFDVQAGSSLAGKGYLILVGASGSTPATVVDGTSIPLAIDAVTLNSLTLANTPFFPNFSGVLDGSGSAQGMLALPPLSIPGLAGLKLTFAAITLAPVSWASNPVEVEFAQ